MVFNLKFKTINKDVFSVEFVFFFLVIVQVYKLINKMKNEDSDASDSDYIVNENKKSKVRYSQGYIEKGTEEYKDARKRNNISKKKQYERKKKELIEAKNNIEFLRKETQEIEKHLNEFLNVVIVLKNFENDLINLELPKNIIEE